MSSMEDLTALTDAQIDATVRATDRELHEAVHRLIETHAARLAPLLAERDRRTRAAVAVCRAGAGATLAPVAIESAERVSDIG